MEKIKSDFDIFTDILTRGGIRWYTQEWISMTEDGGKTVVMRDWNEAIPIDFHADGSVVQVKIPKGYEN